MVYYSLSKTGAFILPAYVACGKCIVQKEEQVLNAVCADPSTSTCWVVHEARLSHSAVWCTLYEEQFFSYCVHPVQGLQPGDSNLCP